MFAHTTAAIVPASSNSELSRMNRIALDRLVSFMIRQRGDRRFVASQRRRPENREQQQHQTNEQRNMGQAARIEHADPAKGPRYQDDNSDLEQHLASSTHPTVRYESFGCRMNLVMAGCPTRRAGTRVIERQIRGRNRRWPQPLVPAISNENRDASAESHKTGTCRRAATESGNSHPLVLRPRGWRPDHPVACNGNSAAPFDAKLQSVYTRGPREAGFRLLFEEKRRFLSPPVQMTIAETLNLSAFSHDHRTVFQVPHVSAPTWMSSGEQEAICRPKHADQATAQADRRFHRAALNRYFAGADRAARTRSFWAPTFCWPARSASQSSSCE